MNFDELKELNEECADLSMQFNMEFMNVFKSWMNKSPRLAIIMVLHLPINMIMNIIDQDDKNYVYNVFPELPDMFLRFVSPFIKLREKWGKIPNKEFVEEYRRLYESQFEKWFPDASEKEKFKQWFEKQNE